MLSYTILTTLLLISPTIAKKGSCDTTTKPCPTVTSTAEVCSTCITLPCLDYSVIPLTQSDCPAHVSTVSTSFPCSKSECPSGCDTSYVYASSYGTASSIGASRLQPAPTITSRSITGGSTVTVIELTPISTGHVSSVIPIPDCPTVTETKTICSDCIRPLCLSLSTVSSVCGCPTAATTVTTAFSCGGDCPVGCGTWFVTPTVTPDCK